MVDKFKEKFHCMKTANLPAFIWLLITIQFGREIIELRQYALRLGYMVIGKIRIESIFMYKNQFF